MATKNGRKADYAMVDYLELSIDFFQEQLSCKPCFEPLITINGNVKEIHFSLFSCEDMFLKPGTGQFITE